MTCSIRFATTSDIAECKRLVDLFRDVFGYIPSSWLAEAAQQRRLAVAECDGKCVGFVRFRVLQRVPATRVYTIVVHPLYQRRGIGKNLLQFVELFSQRVLLLCPSRLAANDFYHRLG